MVDLVDGDVFWWVLCIFLAVDCGLVWGVLICFNEIDFAWLIMVLLAAGGLVVWMPWVGGWFLFVVIW